MLLVHWKQDYFNNCFSGFWKSYEMCKRIAFLSYCSHKMNKFLIQNINLACGIHDISISWVNLPNICLNSQTAVTKLNVYLSWSKFSSIYF